MVIEVDHSVLAQDDEGVRIEVVLYLLIAPAVLLTFVDSDLEQLGISCEGPASDIHIFFVFHTVTGTYKDFCFFVRHRVFVRVLVALFKLQFCLLCVELIIGYRACQNLHRRDVRAWNLEYVVCL